LLLEVLDERERRAIVEVLGKVPDLERRTRADASRVARTSAGRMVKRLLFPVRGEEVFGAEGINQFVEAEMLFSSLRRS
jgi:hypothetical protein